MTPVMLVGRLLRDRRRTRVRYLQLSTPQPNLSVRGLGCDRGRTSPGTALSEHVLGGEHSGRTKQIRLAELLHVAWLIERRAADRTW